MCVGLGLRVRRKGIQIGTRGGIVRFLDAVRIVVVDRTMSGIGN